MRFLRCTMAICRKDLLTEARQRETVSTVCFFGLVVVLLFGFAVGSDTSWLTRLAPGLLWLTILLSVVVALERSFQAEAEEGCMDRLILYTASHRAVFLGKCVTNFCVIVFVQLIVGLAMTLLYDLPFPRQPGLLTTALLLGDVGIAVLGTFYSAVLSKTRARHVMLPLLLFPMLIPLLVSVVTTTQAALVGDLFGETVVWLRLLVLFDAIFIAAVFWTIDPLMEA